MIASSAKFQETNPPYTTMLLDSLGGWMQRNLTQEFMTFKRNRISLTLSDNFDRELSQIEAPCEFAFSAEKMKEHALIMAFLHLYESGNALGQCEYYFRRFPFKSLPVSRDEHLRNTCELYFGAFYVVKSRIKIVLNQLIKVCPNCKLDVGAFIKAYDREFDQELRERNGVHHKSPFSDLTIDRVYITRAISSSDAQKNKGWDKEHLATYRKFSKEWADRVKRRSATVMMFIEAVARLIMDEAHFLKV